MRVLGIDTATWTASVGVVEDDKVLVERARVVASSHASSLLPLVEETLAGARCTLGSLDLLAISIGPGSFTGLRIGLSVMKGIAMTTGAAVVAVPTLDALAMAVGPRPGLICPVLDARKGEVYAAAFRRRERIECVVETTAISPQRFAGCLDLPCTLVGDGVDAYATIWRELLGDGAELLPAAALSPSGGVVAQLGTALALARGVDDMAQLEPRYVRRSEAELNRSGRC